eukprot:Selendium_serpulae@DN5180_c0_g1_i1.p1
MSKLFLMCHHCVSLHQSVCLSVREREPDSTRGGVFGIESRRSPTFRDTPLDTPLDTRRRHPDDRRRPVSRPSTRPRPPHSVAPSFVFSSIPFHSSKFVFSSSIPSPTDPPPDRPLDRSVLP